MKDKVKERLIPYILLDKERLEISNKEITLNDIDRYNQIFLEVLNSIYKDFKVNDYFVEEGILYLIYDFNSPEKLSRSEVLDKVGTHNGCLLEDKIILKGENKLENLLPSEAFKDACAIFTELFELGY